ncbi:GNAT family N-acetyltransferase [Paenibacillus selenitireducens]|jgi:ribosomal-protein-alanine N-acetyltransferase|uniref:GNAT family N-acetyltransferase n=1 Tax=Paenibacillus selenitireducens TaxID=1324314 RepID=A0A1T2X8Q6_9BACL|nr:GNAT family N-acetyltransferase [Paenibacillus selenitireducens]OPA76268.1 GNAT family N-acetyltransferase [Paenibacillus selenitireducens]
MDIFIEILRTTDAEALLKFELENRAFFEEMVPTRGDDYYNPEIFNKRHEALLEEQAQGGSYFYLIKAQEGSILGRINLVDIDKSQKIGHLGYRVGQAHTGKGIAHQALKLLLETVTDKDILKIHAQTTTNNIASQKVLEKNGFKSTETADEEFEMNGQKFKFVYYTWTNGF